VNGDDDIDTRARGPIHSGVRESLAIDHGEDGEAAHVITGWVCIVESMSPSGERWLHRISSDASGERRLPRWAEQGLLYNCLHDEGWADDD
jgi:hypothetical protein